MLRTLVTRLAGAAIMAVLATLVHRVRVQLPRVVSRWGRGIWGRTRWQGRYLIGLLVLLSVAVLLLAFAPPNIFLFFLPMMVMAFGNGIAQPSAIAAAVSVRPGLAGTASGLVGALQMGFGALMTVAAGATEDGHGGATVVCMLLCAVGTQVFLRGVPRGG